MKIVHMIETLKTGGKERQMLELVRGLRTVGVASDIIVQADAIEYDVGDLAGHVHVLSRRSRWDVGLIGRTKALVDRLQPDVLHSWGTMPSVYAIPITRFGRLPFIAGHIRDAPSHLSRLDKRWWHGRLAEPFAAAIVANSKAGLAAYRVSGPKAHVVYNGFDFSGRIAEPDPAFRKALGIDTPFAIGMVARFGSHKDHRTFFAAADLVLAERSDVTFVAVGDGPGLEAWQERYRDNSRVRILGRRSDVERIVAELTIGMLLTAVGDHGEGISNALTECLAAGKPVIATDDGGNRELIADHDCGILLPPADAPAAAHAITGLLDDPDRSRQLGAAGREAVRTAFSRERMTQDYLDLYRRLAAAR